MLTEEELVADDEDKASKAAPSVSEPSRLTHQQRIQFKERTAQMEAKMRIYKTIWYTRWRQIYQDRNAETAAIARRTREAEKNLLEFAI